MISECQDNSDSIRCVLITGCDGLLGRRVVKLFREQLPSTRIIAVDRNANSGDSMQNTEVERISGDLCDPSLWSRLPEQVTHVCHLAAKIPWQEKSNQKADVLIENILPVVRLVENAGKWHDLRGIVFSSSVSVYDTSAGILTSCSKTRPCDLYAASKLACEGILHILSYRSVSVTVLRLSSLYGAGQYQGTVLPLMINRATNGEIINVHGDGTRTQDFLYCNDAAMAVYLACVKATAGVYPIGFGTPTTMMQLAETVSEIFADGCAKIILSPEIQDVSSSIKVDISEAQRAFGYVPQYPLRDGLCDLKNNMAGIKK